MDAAPADGFPDDELSRQRERRRDRSRTAEQADHPAGDAASMYGAEVLPSADGDERRREAARTFGASVLEDDRGGFRMWYSAHDGGTGRILVADQQPGCGWLRQGVAVDAGFAGETDAFAVESPCVVGTSSGHVMAYAGSNGADTQLHLATSTHGRPWTARGTFMERGDADAVGATHPCLVRTGAAWWLFYAGYDGAADGRRSTVMAAISRDGASWDRVGVVLEPEADELAVNEPWVVLVQRRFFMLYVSADREVSSIQMATSDDGIGWQRRGSVLGGATEPRSVRSPCVVRLADGRFRLWYAARPSGHVGVEAGERLWCTELPAL